MDDDFFNIRANALHTTKADSKGNAEVSPMLLKDFKDRTAESEGIEEF